MKFLEKIFEFVDFDDYDKYAQIECSDNEAVIQLFVPIPNDCYDEKKEDWDDNKMCNHIDRVLANIFGKNRAKVERPYEVITPDEFPRAINFTL